MQVLVVVVIFIFINLKDLLMKILQLLLQVIIASIHDLSIKARVEFKGRCLKQYKITYTNRKIVKIYIAYEVCKSYNISSYPTLETCLFGGVSLTKISDVNKYKNAGYGIRFDSHGFFEYPSGGTGRNVKIFGVDMSSFRKNS